MNLMNRKSRFVSNFTLGELRLIYRALTCLYNTSNGYIDEGGEIVKLKRKVRKIVDEMEK